MYYIDPLYGKFSLTKQQIRLFQTEALTRLRDISLSAVPPLATPMGMITSRFEHSVGVGFLAQELLKKPDFAHLGNNLYLACLLHDAGSPPFSHASESLLEDITGKTHEEYVSKVLETNEMKKVIADLDADGETIFKLITGQMEPWSDLLNGTIDLDNIDNSLRWSLGAGILQSAIYDPQTLIQAFTFQKGKLYLDLDYHSEIQKWELCRRLTYDLIYSDENLAPGTMLFRAMEFAYNKGELKEDFFNLTESQAFYILENRCNKETTEIIKDIRYWRVYQKAAELKLDTPHATETCKIFCQDWKQRSKIADIIADSLSIPRHQVSVHAGKDKGFKQIHLPFIGEHSQLEEHQPLQKLYWRIKIYIHPSQNQHIAEVQDLLENLVNEHN